MDATMTTPDSGPPSRRFAFPLLGPLRRFGPALLSHLGLLGLWYWASASGAVPAYILPSPAATLQTVWNPQYNWHFHLFTTAMEVFGGYALAVAVGMTIALVFSWSRLANSLFMPLLVTLNMVPKVAMAPLFIVWLSYGVVPNMVITFTICFFPIVLTTMRGLKEVEPDLLDLVKTLKGTRWQVFTKIQLPSSLPYLFSGMKVAAVLAVAGAVVGEFIGSDRGIGYLLLNAQAVLDTPAMFMALGFITLIGIFLYAVVLALEYLLVVGDARVK